MIRVIIDLMLFGFPLSAAQQPNIILILADDMGSGEPSHAGGLIPTPAIDQMAKEGMRFTDAHTSSSVCTPTRYSILTGRYNWRSRLKGGVLGQATDQALMEPKRFNVGNLFQQAGYSTACIGKWHLGADFPRRPKGAELPPGAEGHSWEVDYSQPFKNGPVDVGFDTAFFILSSLDMPPYVYLRNDKAVSIPTVNKGWSHNEYNDYKRVGAGAEDFDAANCLGDWAKEGKAYIKSCAEDPAKKPFFLYLALTSPHTPIVPSPEFKGRYKQYSWYADFIAETDWVVEQVLSQLKESGIDDNTMVIYTSDNGFAPYVKIPKMFEAGYRPSGPWRGAKANLYEGGHRVPFLVRWPAAVKPGTICDQTVCTTDFFATFADVLGMKDKIPDTAAEDSFSFSPNLQGSSEIVRTFTIHHSINGSFAIRKGDWKLLLTAGSGGGWELPYQKIETPAKLVQLYNLKDDPGETNNLEEAHADKIKELVDDLAKALKDGRTTPGEPQQNDGWPFRDKKILQAFPQLNGE